MSQKNMEPAQKSSEALAKTKMSTVGVVALIFSFVAAGAFGIEEAIAAAGPGVTILMLIVFPFIWSFPLCEMVGELGSLLPNEGGVYAWGREAFGEFWGWQVGLWSAVTTWLCQAEYCALVAGYAAKLIDLSPTGSFMVKVAVVVVFTIVNLIGLDWLERLETFFIVLVVAAFGAVAVVGFMNWNQSPMVPMFNPEEGVIHSIGEGTACIIWMYMGYECMSNMAGELENPQIIPKAMRISQPVVALSYILPTVASLACIGNWAAWSIDSGAGHVNWTDVLIQGVGQWAGVFFVIVAIISNCSIFCSYIAHGSRAFFVMADDHMFPKFMAKVDKRGIPNISILLLAAFTIFTCQFDFVTLVMATNPIQLYLYLLLVACVIKLRKVYPVEERKKLGLTIMPGGKIGMYVMSVSVILVALFTIFVNGTDFFIAGYVCIFGGLIAYILCKWVYKGRYIDDPELYPLNPKTKLGVGDMFDIGTYLMFAGAMSSLASVFLYFYERDYGAEYYLEEYGTGVFSNFSLMLNICMFVGLACIAVGFLLAKHGKKTEGELVKSLTPRRQIEMDNMIREIHGAVPRKDAAVLDK